MSITINATASRAAALIARGGAAAAAGYSAGLNGTQPFLFIGVLSQPAAIERRQAVRETWMATVSPEVAFKFVLYQVRSRNPDTLDLQPTQIHVARRVASLRRRGLWRSQLMRCCLAVALTLLCAFGFAQRVARSPRVPRALKTVFGSLRRRRRRWLRWRRRRRTAT